MRIIDSDSEEITATLAQGLRPFKHLKWVGILAATSLLLVVVLWVAVPPMGQAQGNNTAPTAVDDNAATAENTAVDINVVANDTDPEEDILSVTSVATPTHGTAGIVPGSTTTVTYSPNAGFNGADSFDYTISDGTDTDTGTVTVTVGPPAQPSGLTAAGGDDQATLAWDDPFNSSITGYEYMQAQVAKLTASDGAAGDEFGDSVAVDGDTMVVGARRDDDNALEPGSAYVFTRQSGAWSPAAKLTASDGAFRDHFGGSVAVDGDTVVVGALWDDDNGSDSGSAYVFTKPADGWTTTSSFAAKLTPSDGAADDWFGGSVAVDGDTVVVGAHRDDGSGSAYVFIKPADGWTTTTSFTAKLTASDGAGGDRFGVSVAVDGDTVVAGASGDGDKGSKSGSAYVFTKPADGWTTTSTFAAKLTASDGAAEDYFGWVVAVDEDTAVVGAYGDDANGDESGSAYVFTKPADGWTTTSSFAAKLKAPDGAAEDHFGWVVAVDGDMVVVGAYTDHDNGSDSGSAYLFTKPATGWTSTSTAAKLTASDGAADDWFGASVAVDGDTVVVGASLDDDNGSDSGSAYVYEVSDWNAIPNSGASETNATSYTVTGLTNGTAYEVRIRAVNAFAKGAASDIATVGVGPLAKPTGFTAGAGDAQATLTWDDPSNSGITGYDYLQQAQVSKLTASDGTASDNFGSSVSVDGDTAVVGAWGDGNSRGSAYVFAKQSGAWNQVAKLTASDGAGGDEFGKSVGMDGDTVVVSARGEDYFEGAAYVFTKPTSGEWADATETAKLTASDGTSGDNFGSSVAVDGDTVVVGARQDDDNGSSSGSSYVFTKPANGWADATETAKLTASDGAAFDNFGRSAAVDGDTVVVGAFGDDDNGSLSGSAYVFTKPNTGWADATETAKLTASDGAADDYFGISIAVDGGTVVAGAFWDDDNGDESGSAYVFTEPNSGWADATETAKLTASDGATFDYLGFSVAVDGGTVVVGARRDDDDGENSGSVYLFTKPAIGGWADATETAKLTASDGAADDQFGWSVAVDGDMVVVGAWYDDDNGADSGSAYLFKLSDWTDIPDSAPGDTNATSYTVTGLINGVNYRFKIRATNNLGTGPASDTVTVTPVS